MRIAATAVALFPDAADRENIAIAWDYDCDDDRQDGNECWDDCYVELDIDQVDWESQAAGYFASEEVGYVIGDEWHSCRFNATYDAAADTANISLQMCMMNPVHTLATTLMHKVTNGRATRDNHPGKSRANAVRPQVICPLLVIHGLILRDCL
jgi:hypothetical protein